MDGRGHVNIGALLQGAALTAVLGGLMLGALFVRPGPGAARDEGGETLRPGPRSIHTPVIGERVPVHLVILIDDGLAPGAEGTFARALDVGSHWIVSVEVVRATETMLRGLEEAAVVQGMPCDAPSCTELIVLDLRTTVQSRRGLAAGGIIASKQTN